MSSGKKHSRSRSRTTTARSTIRVRNPAAGVVYHLVFEGSLRKLTGKALAHHLAAVSGVPEAQQSLFTEEGRRVRPEDDGRALGLADGATLTLQLPAEAQELHPDAGTSNRTGHPYQAPPTTNDSVRSGSSMDVWRKRRAKSPAYAVDAVAAAAAGNGYAGQEAHRQRHGLHGTATPSAASLSSRGAPNAIPDAYRGAARRHDDGFGGAGDRAAPTEDSYTAAYPSSPQPRPYQGSGPLGSPNPYEPQPPRPRQPYQQPLPYYPASSSHGSSTVPSPADERDVREDFTHISSTPLPLPRPNAAAAAAHHRDPRDSTFDSRLQHLPHRGAEAVPGRAETGLNTTSFVSSPAKDADGRSPREPHQHSQGQQQRRRRRSSRSRQHRSRNEEGSSVQPHDATASDGDPQPGHYYEGEDGMGPAAASQTALDGFNGDYAGAVRSVLAGVTPEEQAQMTADELAELLADREYVWQMEQQRFHTEREHHRRELQRREKELLYEAQMLAHQQAEMARETERERRRLAELQTARALPSPTSTAVVDRASNRLTDRAEVNEVEQQRPYRLHDRLLAGKVSTGLLGMGGGAEADGDAASSVHVSLNNNYGSKSSPIGSVQRQSAPPTSSAGLTGRAHESAAYASGMYTEGLGTSATPPPAGVAPLPLRPSGMSRSGIQVLSTSRGADGRPFPSPRSEGRAVGASSESPLPRPHPQQPMSLFYSTVEDRAPSGSNSATGQGAPRGQPGSEAYSHNNTMLRTDLF